MKRREKERVSSSLLFSTARGYKTEEIEWGRRDCLLLAHSGIAVRVGEANTSRWGRKESKNKVWEISKMKRTTTHQQKGTIDSVRQNSKE